MTDDTPLHMATFQQLWEEIKRRTVGAILVKETKLECAADETETQSYYHGGINRSLGLAERLRGSILKEILDDTARVDDKDHDDA